MKILIVNTSDNQGGAATAAFRLMEALNNNGHKAKMLVRDKNTSSITVAKAGEQQYSKWHFLYERLSILKSLRGKRNNLFAIDIANSGIDITKTREFQEADVIHLHWINQGMLSLNGIRKILESEKPVVWTMHDMWPATAICHLTLNCTYFYEKCHNCMLLPNGGSKRDLSTKIWEKKEEILSKHSLTFVTCSKWLKTEAMKSALLKGQKIINIPNPIDIRIFQQADKAETRKTLGLPTDKKIVMFSALRITNQYKGIDYLIEACKIMTEKHPETTDAVALMAIGGDAEKLVGATPLTTLPIGYISNTKQMVEYYNAADIFVLPSLSENLPNTIMEAMACGIPSVGFNVGGIPEMIEHGKTGYVAKYKDSGDLAEGIYNMLFVADYDTISRNAVAKVKKNYSESAVALKYTEVYNAAIAQKHYNL